MLLNLIISTCFYTCMLGFGHLMNFIDPVIYETIPIYFLLLIVVMKSYHETCKAMELKDHVITSLFVAGMLVFYAMQGLVVNFHIASFLYLATFLPYVAYASSIRYKSLM